MSGMFTCDRAFVCSVQHGAGMIFIARCLPGPCGGVAKTAKLTLAGWSFCQLYGRVLATVCFQLLMHSHTASSQMLCPCDCCLHAQHMLPGHVGGAASH
jgi:hypothetical protein